MDRFERFTVAVTEISYHIHRLMNEVMEQYGLRGVNAIYLVVLRRHKEGITAARLGEYCSRDKADVSRAITSLEKKGLVVKDAGRYRAKLQLTAQGGALADRIRALAQRAVEQAGRDISDADRVVMYAALESIGNHLQDLTVQALSEKEL